MLTSEHKMPHLGVVELEAVLHPDGVAHAHEVVVPTVVLRHHEEAQEPIRQQHLHLSRRRSNTRDAKESELTGNNTIYSAAKYRGQNNEVFAIIYLMQVHLK